MGKRLRVHVYCGISQTGSLRPGTDWDQMLRIYRASYGSNPDQSGPGDARPGLLSMESTDRNADRFAAQSEATLAP